MSVEMSLDVGPAVPSLPGEVVHLKSPRTSNGGGQSPPYQPSVVVLIVSSPVFSEATGNLINNTVHQEILEFDTRAEADAAAEAYQSRRVEGLVFTAIKLY